MMNEKIIKKCACCGRTSISELYEPLPPYYKQMRTKYQVIEHVFEFLNEEEYFCKYCYTSDRGRMTCAFMEMAKLPYAKRGTRLLQIAPEKGVEDWVLRNCPNVLYESTDLYNEDVSFQSDIQNMDCIESDTYDYFICSHVLEHVENDHKAMRELARILKPDGIGILIVPICLDAEEIEEEWGLTEAENWRRFGQNDHCRIYSKKGIIERLKDNGLYVHLFDKKIFGEKTFRENSFVETATLYILSKTEDNTENLVKKLEEKACYEDFRKGQSLLFSSCVKANESIYTITNLERFPIKIDLQKETMTYIDGLEKYDLLNSEDMIAVDNDIYVFELDGRRLMKCNMVKKQCYYYDINCHVKDWGNYAAYAIFRKYIYIFPKYTEGIVRIDLEKDEVISNYKLYIEMINTDLDIVKKEDYAYFEYGLQDGNIVWIFQKSGDLVVAYDMETDTWKNYRLPWRIRDCVHVILYKKIFYILSSEGQVYSWDNESNNINILVDCSDEKKKINRFARMAMTDDSIYLLPFLDEDIYKIDLYSGEIIVYDDYPNAFQYVEPEGWSKYFGYCEDDENYYFAMRSSVHMFCINKKTGAARWISPIMLPKDYLYMYVKYNGSILREGKWDIKTLVSSSGGLNKKHAKGFKGKQIWRYLNEMYDDNLGKNE